MGIPDHLTCLLRNLYVGQEATVRTRHGTTDWFKIRKGVRQSCILSPCLFNFCAEYIMWNPGWMNHKLESRLPGEMSVILDAQIIPSLWQKQRGTEEPLDESERGEWKIWLKIQYSKNEDDGIRSHHFMANRWWNNENRDRLYFLGLQNHGRWWLQPWN